MTQPRHRVVLYYIQNVVEIIEPGTEKKITLPTVRLLTQLQSFEN
jgi:hypothetical protein